MQTMTALVRIEGNPAMTVMVQGVTPAEAWLLMDIHDPETRDVFEKARLTGDVTRSKIEERERLHARYPEQSKRIDILFPGRSAHDIPERFDELEATPLELDTTKAEVPVAAVVVAETETATGEVYARPAPTPPLTDEQTRALLGKKTKEKV